MPPRRKPAKVEKCVMGQKVGGRNYHGEIFQVLIGSSEDLQGIDLDNTLIMHQMEELESHAQEKQLDGRTARTLANCGYPRSKKGWTNIKYKYVFDSGEDGEDIATQQAKVIAKVHQLQPLLEHLRHGINEYNQTVRVYQQTQQQVVLYLHKLVEGRLNPTEEAETQTAMEKAYQNMRDKQGELTNVQQQLLAQSNVDPQTMNERSVELEATIVHLQKQAAQLAAGQSLNPPLPSIEAEVRQKAAKDYALLEVFNLALRQIALDCPTLKPINSLPSDTPALSCGINEHMDYTALKPQLLHLYNTLRGGA